MGTKLYKCIVYLVDIDNYNESTPKELEIILENDRHLIGELGQYNVVDIGEWKDDIDINQYGANYETYENYFKE
ncbi:MAG: hypothetical protein GQ557_01375 [Mycoplasmataceae bacterium]|nr:hypothetical protein [Mycoplasmataceae bacterium]